jgi:hypothetical protein
LKLRLLHDGFTKFQRLLAHGVVDLRCRHGGNVPALGRESNWIRWD